MRLLVTGGLGFIGSHFVEIAEADGHRVEILDCLNYAGRTLNLPGRVQGEEWHRVDICDRRLVCDHIARFNPCAIVHFAAESHVARSIECRDEFLRTNVMGTYTLLEAALWWWQTLQRRVGAHAPFFRFLHVSTDEVYGSLAADEAPWTEASPYAPNNPYAASKAASDHLVRAYHRTFGLPTITTHSSNNYGSRQHPEKLIPTLIGQLLRGHPMTLHGDGENVRDWLHVEDHCRGLLATLHYDHLGPGGEVFNFGGRCERANIQIARLVHEAIAPGSFPAIHLIQDRPGNDMRYASDVQKASTVLGWKPGAQIESRIAETVAWYMRNPDYEIDYGH